MTSTVSNNPPGPALGNVVIHQQAAQVVNAMALAVKNAGIYPEDHTFYRNAQKKLLADLHRFVDNHGPLCLAVKKNRIVYDGQTVFERPDHEISFASLLNRDGLLSLEFSDGIEDYEITGLIKVINRHALVDDVNDENIVTALWQEDFPHIEHKAVDPFEDSPMFDLGACQVRPRPVEEGARGEEGSSTSADGAVSEARGVRGGAIPISLGLAARGRDLWRLTEEERAQLRQMVLEEEETEHIDDVIEVALIILLLQDNEQDVRLVLDFLEECFMMALEQRHLHAALNLVGNLHDMRDRFTAKKPWSLELFNDFFRSVSTPESLRELPVLLGASGQPLSDGQLHDLCATLTMLRPEVLTPLGPLLAGLSDSKLRRDLVKVVVHHARRDFRALYEAILGFDQETCMLLFALVSRMGRENALPFLKKMVRHASGLVRRKALEMLLNRSPDHVDDLAMLLGDDDELVRNTLLDFLGATRNADHEGLLVEYLAAHGRDQGRPEHVLRCFLALGCCGSANAIPFLRQLLFEHDIRGILGRGGHTSKQGAAMALRNLHLDEAEDLLRQGAESMIPDTRNASREALQSKRQKR